ncbi:MAG TPA: DEAD/DEAH box helicase [Burkholderiaceae bacterium]|nr:DEAD/DEAH box helicase [Burkholderiaceae bacterium]
MSDYSDFDHFGLDPRLIAAVRAMGYLKPTPIQSKAIPIVMVGKDVMGAAQTGTGKTAGFALPILHRLLAYASTSMSPARHPVRALILTPTRELADQVASNVQQYAAQTPLRCTVVFGGVDMEPQTQALRAGVEVIVATPGRLLDHLQSKNTSLAQVQSVVLDEADRMLDMGFLPDISRILQQLPRERQSLMFSATFSEDIKRLAANFLREPVLVEVAQRNSAAQGVRQELVRVHESEKGAALLALLDRSELSQVLVFVNTKIGARRLARQLQRDGINADAIHGDKTQEERMKALEAFKAGAIRVLVATDVAARGLDITELPAVVNYDVPFAPEDYVHRIGRTGRAGASGLAINIVTGADERAIAAIEKLIKSRIVPAQVQLPQGQRPIRDLTRGPQESARGARAFKVDSRSEGRGRVREDRTAQAARARDVPALAQSADDFFYKPYEPNEQNLPSGEQAQKEPAQQAASEGGTSKPARRAALLGGSKR